MWLRVYTFCAMPFLISLRRIPIECHRSARVDAAIAANLRLAVQHLMSAGDVQKRPIATLTIADCLQSPPELRTATVCDSGEGLEGDGVTELVAKTLEAPWSDEKEKMECDCNLSV